MLDEDRRYLVKLGVYLGATLLATLLSTRLVGLIEEMGPNRRKNKSLAYERLEELGIPMGDLDLSKHEIGICTQIVVPSSIEVSWDDIGGLDKEIQILKESVIWPIVRQDLFLNSKSKLLTFPKGVLLSGPPGCGKTMIAKATAKESGCLFINLDMSIVHDMWVGESPKYVQAIFTLAEKLSKYAPVIVFIDEIDTLLSTRRTTDHENTQLIKGTFMMNWDGLISSKQTRVVVMGATNKPDQIDSAVYRRMPVRINIGLPTRLQRTKILETLLRDEDMDASIDVSQLSAATDTMSGSDIKEYCSQACMVRYRDLFRNELQSGIQKETPVRPVTMTDFVSTAHLFGNNVLSRYFSNEIALD